MGRVEVRQTVLQDVVAHARAEAPNECCGLLIGTSRRIERAVRARNLRASPTRYLVDPVDQLAAIRSARAEGVAVVGAYHSHPASPPVPSATDLAETSYPEFVYLIVSPGGGDCPTPDTRAYRLVGGNFRQLTIVPVA